MILRSQVAIFYAFAVEATEGTPAEHVKEERTKSAAEEKVG
jgi:hypothetical protein